MSMSRIGHRGAAGYEVENTLKSIKKALTLGVDMIELDVRRCATGELVVFHDATVNRVTNGKGAIRKKTLAEIKALRTIDGQKILTLNETLAIIAGRVDVNLDIKSKGITAALVKTLHQFVKTKQWRQSQFLISSFHHKELQRIKKLDSHIRIGLLYYRRIRSALKRAKKMAAYSVHFHVHHLNKKLIEALRRSGIKSFAWTVNNAFDAKNAYKLGVRGIISDYPDIV